LKVDWSSSSSLYKFGIVGVDVSFGLEQLDPGFEIFGLPSSFSSGILLF